MGTPQIILIVLVAMSGTVILINHGKPRPNFNFPIWAAAAAVQFGLMYWGGFFG
jgi:hypothetical protein